MPNKKKLYEALKAEGYDNFADESAFNSYVDNPDNRKKLFNALKSEGSGDITLDRCTITSASDTPSGTAISLTNGSFTATNTTIENFETDIQLTGENRIPCPELTGKALVDHANQLFQMYSGDAVYVKLRFSRRMMNAVIDRFGKDTMLIPDGEEHFNFTVNVAVSPMFLSWIIGFGAKAKILYPQSVADACKQLCLEAMSQYAD